MIRTALHIFYIGILATSVNAGWLTIEKEDDLERVYNNVSSFWSSHSSEFETLVSNLKEKKWEESSTQQAIRKILEGKSELVQEATEDSQSFYDALQKSISYLKTNSAIVKRKVKEDRYNILRNSLFLIDKVFKSAK